MRRAAEELDFKTAEYAEYAEERRENSTLSLSQLLPGPEEDGGDEEDGGEQDKSEVNEDVAEAEQGGNLPTKSNRAHSAAEDGGEFTKAGDVDDRIQKSYQGGAEDKASDGKELGFPPFR